MPLSYRLSKKEIVIISLIQKLKNYEEVKKGFLETDKIPKEFEDTVESLKKLAGIKSQNSIGKISLFSEVDSKYVNDETEDVNGVQKISYTYEQFSTYVKKCTDSQYLYFRFTKSNRLFSLGYVDKDCKSLDCSFIGSNIHSSLDTFEYLDSKEKAGVIHTKEEIIQFLEALKNDSPIYLFKKKYKSGKGGGNLPFETVILSNSSTISSASRLENKGGACCPPF